MTTIDPNSAQAALFEKLGITNQAGTQKAAKDTLGQSDFLKLMTTQLQNQDPFAPMDNGDFIAQMAQFSTVTGIQEVNNSISQLVEEFDQARIATASNLLGHSVLVPGNIGRADEKGQLHGVLDLPEQTFMTQLTYYDAETNEKLFSDDLLSRLQFVRVPEPDGDRTPGLPANLLITQFFLAQRRSQVGDIALFCPAHHAVDVHFHQEMNAATEIQTQIHRF